MNLIQKVEAAQLKSDQPDLRPGDLVEVSVRVIEGDKERQQKFRGDVINVRGSGMRKTFTVRKISEGVGVERTFPLHGPSVGRDQAGAALQGAPREAVLPAQEDRQGRPPHRKKTDRESSAVRARQRTGDQECLRPPGEGSPDSKAELAEGSWSPASMKPAAVRSPDRWSPRRWCCDPGAHWDGSRRQQEGAAERREMLLRPGPARGPGVFVVGDRAARASIF